MLTSFFLGNFWFGKLWFVHSFCSLAVFLWFLLFILLCYNVKLGKHFFFVYTWIWFDIWCLLLIKAFFFFLIFFMNFMVSNGKPCPKKKKKLLILPLYRISYLVFLLFYWFQYLFYTEILSAFFFSFFYYGLPTLPLILLLTIIPIFVSLWFHMFEEMLMRRVNKKNDNHVSWIIPIILLVNLIDKWVYRIDKNCSCVFH